MLLELGMKAEAAGDKVEEELSALSVVSALLAVVTFSLLLTVPAKMDLPENLAQKRAYGVITSTALMLNLARSVAIGIGLSASTQDECCLVTLFPLPMTDCCEHDCLTTTHICSALQCGVDDPC